MGLKLVKQYTRVVFIRRVVVVRLGFFVVFVVGLRVPVGLGLVTVERVGFVGGRLFVVVRRLTGIDIGGLPCLSSPSLLVGYDGFAVGS